MPDKSQMRRLITLTLIGASFMTGIDLFIVNVAFDQIGRDFSTGSLSSLSWILNAYAVVFAALLVPMGRLTDRYGRKSGFVAGLAVFTLASLMCGFSTNVWELVAFRGFQAIGAAAMTPTSLGLLLAALPPERRAPAARMWALTSALAAALGPAVGGFLVGVSWEWAFWINVPIGIVLVVAALRWVPDVRHNQDAPRPDIVGGVIVALAIGALVLGIVEGNDWGWSSGRVVGSFIATVVLVGLFAWQTTHHAAPVIDPALLRVRAFVWADVAAIVFNIGFGIGLLSRILWMQEQWGYGAIRTGLAVALGPLCVPITSIAVHRVFPRARPGAMIAAGSLCFGLSGVWGGALLSTTPSYWSTFFLPWVLGGVGVGLAMPNLVSGATSDLPAEHASTGSGVISMARQIGMALGISLLVSIVGSGVPSPDHTRAAWYVLAGSCLLAALAGLAMDAVRRPVPEVVPIG